MIDILKPFFKTKEEIDNFESEVSSRYDFQIKYFKSVCESLDNYPPFVNSGIGFTEKEDRRCIIELVTFSEMFLERFSESFQQIYAVMTVAIGTNRITIDTARSKGRKKIAGEYYIYYIGSYCNIGLALLNELMGKDPNKIKFH